MLSHLFLMIVSRKYLIYNNTIILIFFFLFPYLGYYLGIGIGITTKNSKFETLSKETLQCKYVRTLFLLSYSNYKETMFGIIETIWQSCP